MDYYNTGLQDTLTDPNTGTTSYGYNGFGELSSQTDARGKCSTILYDVPGRDSVKTSNGVATKNTSI